MPFMLRRKARGSERETFHGPEEGAPVVVDGEWAVLRCAFETTANAARRRGFEDFEDAVAEAPHEETVPGGDTVDEKPSRKRR